MGRSRRDGRAGCARSPTYTRSVPMSYRMITRRAHPNLDAARSRLSWNEQTGRFAPVAAPTAIELGDTYVELCIYVVAKLGMFETSGSGGATLTGFMPCSTA